MVMHTAEVLQPRIIGYAVTSADGRAAGRPAIKLECLPHFTDCLQANSGEATLTRCRLCKHASSPASLMALSRDGAVFVNGPANVTLDHCYLEVGGPLDLGCCHSRQ
jgi:hypothetical protein